MKTEKKFSVIADADSFTTNAAYGEGSQTAHGHGNAQDLLLTNKTNLSAPERGALERLTGNRSDINIKDYFKNYDPRFLYELRF